MSDLLPEGQLWWRPGLTNGECARLAALARSGDRPGQRIAPRSDLTDAVLALDLMERIRTLHPSLRPVRIVAFDKTPESNWALPWHQDRVIAVAERADCEGFSGWSCKDGVWHCEPPPALLNRMVFARIHLDACDAENGSMDYALGSHARGLVAADRARAVAEEYPCRPSIAAAGDVLFLPMLTLHRSGPSQAARPRRTLRVDFAPDDLPSPLRWALSVRK